MYIQYITLSCPCEQPCVIGITGAILSVRTEPHRDYIVCPIIQLVMEPVH